MALPIEPPPIKIIDETIKEELWNLFKETGKIKYYLEYKKLAKNN